MLVKMKFVNLIGPKQDLDRAIETYILNHEIQMEDALTELKSVKGLTTVEKTNIYAEPFRRLEELASLQPMPTFYKKETTIGEALEIEEKLNNEFREVEEEKNKIREAIHHYEELEMQMKPFAKLDIPIEELINLKFIKFRFGKMPRDSYKIYDAYLKQRFEALFIVSSVDSDYAWGIYFEPSEVEERLDALFSSLHFERTFISAEMKGTPDGIYSEAASKIRELKSHLQTIELNQKKELENQQLELSTAYNIIRKAYLTYDIRKSVAIRKNEYYIIVGWMTEKETEKLEKEVAKDHLVTLVIEDPNEAIASSQPVKLENFKIFKPFESFVKMYSMPAYSEFDPTMFLAITYTVLFGAMFGDFGQGAVLFIISLLLYRLKEIPLAGIGMSLGLSAMVFGLLYGSFFGFEDEVQALWLRPMENITTVLMISVGVGVILIIIAMVIGVINDIRAKEYGKALFSPNSVAGLVFYVSAIVTALLMITGRPGLPGYLTAALLGIPLVLIALHEPLERIIAKKKPYINGSLGQYLIEAFFEMFEVILSYITNTISFVRVGAFALSHAGMMQVVHMLAGGAGGAGAVVILVLGNILVMGLEGLIVGIQVLRLEYYEMFGRFYKGGSGSFKPSATLRND